MSITPEEREEIIEAAVEKALMILPEVVGNLMKARAMYSTLVKDFYDKNQAFREHKDIVQEITAKVEGQDPTLPYEEILKRATPKIKEAIQQRKRVNMDMPERKQLNLFFEDEPKSAPYEPIGGNGEI